MLIDATNLLGDSLYALRPVQELIATLAEDVEAIVVAHPGLAFEMFDRQLGDSAIVLTGKPGDMEFESVVELQAGLSGELCFRHARDNGKQLHISEGFARMLGIPSVSSIVPPTGWDKIPKDMVAQTHITVAPFSRSCSRHTGETPNKTLDDWKWQHIIGYLSRQGYPIAILGAPDDRLQSVTVPENEYYTAANLDCLTYLLRRSKIFVTLDNGLGHIAAALNVPTIILWPMVSSIEFIAPIWSPSVRLMRMEPNSAIPAAIINGLKHYMREMM